MNLVISSILNSNNAYPFIEFLKKTFIYLADYTTFPFPCAYVKFRGSSIINYPCLCSLPLTEFFVPSYFEAHPSKLVLVYPSLFPLIYAFSKFLNCLQIIFLRNQNNATIIWGGDFVVNNQRKLDFTNLMGNYRPLVGCNIVPFCLLTSGRESSRFTGPGPEWAIAVRIIIIIWTQIHYYRKHKTLICGSLHMHS
jgi:hypothetical protein